MNLKKSVLWTVWAVCAAAAAAGCNKPDSNEKKTTTTPLPVPANTTDSK